MRDVRTRPSTWPVHETNGSTATFLESWLATSSSVAYARFAADGTLSRANRRFLEITQAREGEARLRELVAEGQREKVARLLEGGELPGEPANVHFAAGDEGPISLLATWLRDDDELVLLGEAPVADLEAAQSVLVKLNQQVMDLAREKRRRVRSFRPRTASSRGAS